MENAEKKQEKYSYSIDNKPRESNEPIIKGAVIRQKGDVPSDYIIYLKVNGPDEDELIEDITDVDLRKPGREHFYSVKPNTGNG
jgi:hypothetical protein